MQTQNFFSSLDKAQRQTPASGGSVSIPVATTTSAKKKKNGVTNANGKTTNDSGGKKNPTQQPPPQPNKGQTASQKKKKKGGGTTQASKTQGANNNSALVGEEWEQIPEHILKEWEREAEEMAKRQKEEHSLQEEEADLLRQVEQASLEGSDSPIANGATPSAAALASIAAGNGTTSLEELVLTGVLTKAQLKNIKKREKKRRAKLAGKPDGDQEAGSTTSATSTTTPTNKQPKLPKEKKPPSQQQESQQNAGATDYNVYLKLGKFEQKAQKISDKVSGSEKKHSYSSMTAPTSSSSSSSSSTPLDYSSVNGKVSKKSKNFAVGYSPFVQQGEEEDFENLDEELFSSLGDPLLLLDESPGITPNGNHANGVLMEDRGLHISSMLEQHLHVDNEEEIPSTRQSRLLRLLGQHDDSIGDLDVALEGGIEDDYLDGEDYPTGLDTSLYDNDEYPSSGVGSVGWNPLGTGFDAFGQSSLLASTAPTNAGGSSSSLSAVSSSTLFSPFGFGFATPSSIPNSRVGGGSLGQNAFSATFSTSFPSSTSPPSDLHDLEPLLNGSGKPNKYVPPHRRNTPSTSVHTKPPKLVAPPPGLFPLFQPQ